MTHLWLLIFIPLVLFVGTLTVQRILIFTMDQDGVWWSFPLYLALVSPIFMGSILLMVFIGYSAVH